MNNTIPFKSTSRTIRSEQITVDVGILSVLNHAASPGRRELDSNIYLAAIAPDMELNIIMEEDAPHILPCFDEEDATIAIKGAPLFISYNPAQVLTLAGKHYLTGAVIFYRTDSSNHIVSLTVEDVYRFQSYLEMNYLKCLFALGFQGFLILICVAIYAVLIQSVAISGDAINSIWGIVGYTVLLCFSLFKTSSVTKSVLGAH